MRGKVGGFAWMGRRIRGFGWMGARYRIVENEAIYRPGRAHRVRVNLRLGTAAYNCRAVLTEGVCGHADSALTEARAANL